MPRTLEEIHRESVESSTLRGLVGVLHEKLQLRSRYALLEYEAGVEGRPDCAALYREISRLDSDQIARLSAVLAIDLQSEESRPLAKFPLDPHG